MEGRDRAEANIITTGTSTSRDTEDLRGNDLGSVRSQQEGSAEVSADQGRCGYIGGGSVMADASSSELISCPPISNLRPSETDLILRSTKALETPPPTLANALTDSFFDELFPIAPLVDRHELTVDGASHLLRQSVYFAGSLVRRSWTHAPAFSPREFYVKVKTLLFLEIEQDPMVVLRALALVGLWSSGSPKVITLNCPWQWTGEALRLASQLGLHKESSYERLGSSKGLGRRVFWGLFINDTLQSACYGRPPMFRERDLDVILPTSDDYLQSSPSSMVFCAMARLCIQFSRVHEMSIRQSDAKAADVADVIRSLQDWMRDLPADLRLYDDLGHRQTWSRPIVELHIYYFVCIILVYLLPGPHRHSDPLCTASIVASSCAMRMYEEISHRELVHCLLAIHNWTTMVAAVPQKHCLIRHPSLSAACTEELDIGRSILVQMREKYPSADIGLSMFDRSDEPGTDFGGQANSTLANHRNGASSVGQEGICASLLGTWCDAASLFPFPDSFSAKMLLLNQPASSNADRTTEDTSSLEGIGQENSAWPSDMFALEIPDIDYLFPSGTAFFDVHL